MKKWFFVTIGFAILTSCSVKTNEEKARELIEQRVKSNLIKPESYEFAELTLDSCFMNDAEHNADAISFAIKVAKLYKEYKDYMSDAESAESSMSIFSYSYGYQSEHDKLKQKKYKAEMEKAQRKAEAIKDKILKLYKDNVSIFKNINEGKHEFSGWRAVFNYRAETAGGIKTIGGELCFLNKDLTEITYMISRDEMDEIQSAELDDIQYEFEDDLKELFSKE